MVVKLSQLPPWPFMLGATILKPVLLPLASRTWIGEEQVPRKGGCVIAANHISHIDPLTMAHFVYDQGRVPRYLAKSDLFKNRALGAFLSAAGQIPVERLSRNAIGAYAAAVKAVEQGECVVVYPEGTLTRDPDMWPMAGKSGVARIALETGCPVIPVGQWGAHEILPPYSKTPRLVPRKHIAIKAGPPVDLSDLLERRREQAAINEATARVMAAITGLVAELRGENPPPEPYDPRRAKRADAAEKAGMTEKDAKKRGGDD